MTVFFRFVDRRIKKLFRIKYQAIAFIMIVIKIILKYLRNYSITYFYLGTSPIIQKVTPVIRLTGFML